MIYQRPKGTNDILPKEATLWEYLETTAKSIACRYGYQEIRVPIFESEKLFKRSSGETSDVVAKEMYEFTDKGDRQMALRPEGTAGVVRAYIENKLYAPEYVKPLKVYYQGPMFRYERPQSGRSREFNQFGIEAFGVEDPRLDAETIILGWDIIAALGINQVTVTLNTLGDAPSRQSYLKALVNYLTPYKEELSKDSQIRLQKNPLRILDSKDVHDQQIIQNAPKITNYLTDDARKYFDQVQSKLTEMGINYQLNDDLVRGLDYYNHTIFELVYTGKAFGNKPLTVLAGGRYNQLVEELGGPHTPGIGFGLGEERIIEILQKNESLVSKLQPQIDLFLVGVDQSVNDYIFKLAQDLREKGITVEYDYMGRSVKSQLKLANRQRAKFTIVIGEDELKNNEFKLKKMCDGTEIPVKLAEITKNILGEI